MVLFSNDGRPHWSLLSIPCWRHHFPTDTLVAVDHNNNPDERRFAEKHGAVVVPQSTAEKTHGDGIDTAVNWCLANGYDVLVHIEPDCLLWGRDWYKRLLEPIGERRLWMTGHHRHIGTVLHPCPTAWYVPKVSHSYRACAKGDDLLEPEFARIIDVDDMRKAARDNPFHWDWWDTAIKNYYEISKQGRAGHVGPCLDFRHYWGGRYRKPPFPAHYRWDWSKPLEQQPKLKML